MSELIAPFLPGTFNWTFSSATGTPAKGLSSFIPQQNVIYAMAHLLAVRQIMCNFSHLRHCVQSSNFRVTLGAEVSAVTEEIIIAVGCSSHGQGSTNKSVE